MKQEKIIEALTKDALYTYEFDVTTGLVPEDIISRRGFNFTKALGLESPCFFDELVQRSFGDKLKCRYAGDSYIRELSAEALLHAFACGKQRLEADLYRGDLDQYVRLTYFLWQEDDGHVHAYVICDDITDLEKGKDSSAHQNHENLILQRDVLTREKHDLTEERDALTKDKHDLTEERDFLTEANMELTRAAGYVMRRANGSPITCYGLVMDVDEQKKAADKIEEALTQAHIAKPLDIAKVIATIRRYLKK